MYLDGVLVASNTHSISNTSVSGTDLAIGVDVSPSGGSPYTDSNIGYFQGSIDEVRIYDTALSVDQIGALAGITSTPEPASLTLVGSALVALTVIRRRRSRDPAR